MVMIANSKNLPAVIHAEFSKGSAEDTTNKILMKALEDIRDPRILTVVRAMVRHMAETNKYPISGKISEIAIIDHLVRKKIRYTRDPIGVELVHRPSAMLERADRFGRWSEDCESIAGLIITLLMAIGHRCRLTIVGFSMPNHYSHIFVESYIPRVGWVVVDPASGDNEQVVRMCERIKFFKHFYPEQVSRQFQKSRTLPGGK